MEPVSEAVVKYRCYAAPDDIQDKQVPLQEDADGNWTGKIPATDLETHERTSGGMPMIISGYVVDAGGQEANSREHEIAFRVQEEWVEGPEDTGEAEQSPGDTATHDTGALEGETPVVVTEEEAVHNEDDTAAEGVDTEVRRPGQEAELNDDTPEAALASLVDAYENENLSGLMGLINGNYTDATNDGRRTRQLLESAIVFDFKQLDDIKLGIHASDPVFVKRLNRAIITVNWGMEYLHKETDETLKKSGKRSKLYFIDTPKGWRFFYATGDVLFGQSDPVTGDFSPPEVVHARERVKEKEEMDKIKDQFAPDEKTEEKEAEKPWAQDAFVKKVQEAMDAILKAYENEDENGVLEHVSENYRGLTSQNTTQDYYGLPLSLQSDFQIFDGLDFTPAAESFKIFPDRKEAEFILRWDLRGRFQDNNKDFIMRSRRTRLIFGDENGKALLNRQDVENLSDGAIMFGLSDPNTEKVTVKMDAGSQAGEGYKTVKAGEPIDEGGIVSSGGASVSPTTQPGGGGGGGSLRISQNSTFSQDVIVAAGTTLTVDPGVTVTFQGPYKLQVLGTLSASNATFTATGGPGSWQGIIFENGSTGNLNSVTVHSGADGVHVNGGNVTLASVTLSSNQDGLEINGGNVTVTNSTIEGNNGYGIRMVNGAATVKTTSVGASGNLQGALYVSGGTYNTSQITYESPPAVNNVTITGGNITMGPSVQVWRGNNGITISGGTLNMSQSVIFDAAGDGLNATGGNTVITSSNIANNALYGAIASSCGVSVTLNSSYVGQNKGFPGADLSGGACVTGDQLTTIANVNSPATAPY